jgi:hypothetical protein
MGAKWRRGVNMDMAPVLDVNTNAANPVIGDRAFGDSPIVVEEHGLAMIVGLQDRRVIACAKHFPGHGATSADSHLELPEVNVSLRQLERIHLRPFEHAIANRLAAVMTAHVRYPALDQAAPATLSKTILTGLLRRAMGFEGLIITDDLEMQAIADRHGRSAALRRFWPGRTCCCSVAISTRRAGDRRWRERSAGMSEASRPVAGPDALKKASYQREAARANRLQDVVDGAPAACRADQTQVTGRPGRTDTFPARCVPGGTAWNWRLPRRTPCPSTTSPLTCRTHDAEQWFGVQHAAHSYRLM